jgi:23S rRNA (guanine745-N1)-methyltransferase
VTGPTRIIPPLLVCPLCAEPLEVSADRFSCASGHLFDMAREGYVNLLLPQHRRSNDPGYSKGMIAGRRDFFDAGHYEPLADEVARVLSEYLPATGPSVVVDAGCGEGYYLRRLRRLLASTGREADTLLCGIDISKHGIRVAARRDPEGLYVVAGTHRMPVLAGSVDVLLTHFSPVAPDNFRRVVKPGGVVLVGGPAEGHLYALKEELYEKPVQHEPADPLADTDGFEPIGARSIRYPLRLRGGDAVANLLLMTPFYWAVGEETRARIAQLGGLDTEVDVQVRAYRRTAPDTFEDEEGRGR